MLGVDVGGSHVKAKLSSSGEERRFDSGPELTAQQMVDGLRELTSDWDYDVISIGIPAPVREGRVESEPVNLGPGWAGFDFEQAFGKPTKVVNDAVMQAIGSYEGGKMLFLGLGHRARLDAHRRTSGGAARGTGTCRIARRPSRTTSASAAASGSARRSGARRWPRPSSC